MQASVVERAIVAALTETGHTAKKAIQEAAGNIIAAEDFARICRTQRAHAESTFLQETVAGEAINPITGRKHSATSAAELWPHTVEGMEHAEAVARADVAVTMARADYECAKVDAYIFALSARSFA